MRPPEWATIAPRILASSFYALSVGIAALLAWPMFHTLQLLVVIVIGMLAGTGIAGFAALRRWSLLTLTLVTLTAFAVLAPPLAAPDRMRGLLPTWDAVATVAVATVTGWRRLLTIDLPVGTDDGLLVAPFLLVLVATVIGISVLLRTDRGELSVLPPLAILAWTILWGDGHYDRGAGFLTILCGALLTGAVAFVRQARRRARAPRTVSSFARRLAAGLAVGLIAAIAGQVAGALTPLDHRNVLRERSIPPAVTLAAVSPLSTFREFLRPDRADEVMFTVTGVGEGQRIPLATLESYDGVVFAADGERLRRSTGNVEHSDATPIGVTIQSLQSYWMPRVGETESVTFIGSRAIHLQESLHESTSTNSLLTTARLREGDGYRLGSLGDWDQPPLASVAPFGTPALAAELPEEASGWLAERAAQAVSPGEQLDAVARALREEGYFSHGIAADETPSRAGHSLARLADMFDDQMVGDQEQYAVLMALCAEQLGFPARVVMGFAPESSDGAVRVLGRDVDVWTEVSTTSGWIAIDATPTRQVVPDANATPPQQADAPRPPAPPNLPAGGTEADAQTPNGVEPESAASDAQLPGWGVALRWGIAAALMTLLPPLAIIALKRWRSVRRRRAAHPVARAIGAWQDLVDARTDRGYATQDERTRREYAADNAVLGRYADRVDAFAFGATPPEDADIDALWADARLQIARHDAKVRWYRRIGYALRLNSLVYRAK